MRGELEIRGVTSKTRTYLSVECRIPKVKSKTVHSLSLLGVQVVSPSVVSSALSPLLQFLPQCPPPSFQLSPVVP